MPKEKPLARKKIVPPKRDLTHSKPNATSPAHALRTSIADVGMCSVGLQSYSDLRKENKSLREEVDRLQTLLERYEAMLDKVMAAATSAIAMARSTSDRHGASLAKELQPIMEKLKQQRIVLSAGRLKGAAEQKKAAAKTLTDILKVNADLLRHPDTARWTLAERADHIEKIKFKQPNGTPYKLTTIVNRICGKG